MKKIRRFVSANRNKRAARNRGRLYTRDYLARWKIVYRSPCSHDRTTKRCDSDITSSDVSQRSLFVPAVLRNPCQFATYAMHSSRYIACRRSTDRRARDHARRDYRPVPSMTAGYGTVSSPDRIGTFRGPICPAIWSSGWKQAVLPGVFPVSRGRVSTDYEVASAANGRTMILTRETRACNPPRRPAGLRVTAIEGPSCSPNK